MSTLHRRAQQHEKHSAYFTDLILAYNAGFWTCAICAVIVFALWR